MPRSRSGGRTSRPFLILAVGAILPACGGGGGGGGGSACSTDPQDNPADAAQVALWDVLRQQGMSQIQRAAGWGVPELLQGSVNTLGWEDSAFIAPDGARLYFAYLNVDLLTWVQSGSASQATFPAYARGPTRGQPQPPYAFAALGSSPSGAAFCVPDPFPYVQPGVHQWGMHRQGNDWYYIQGTVDNAFRAIHRNGIPLLAPITVDGDEDDPHFADTSFGRELFFWSVLRPGSLGQGDIWVSTENAGTWSDPVLLAGPINMAAHKEFQPHFRPDGTLYFTSTRDGADSIFVSTRLGPNSWSAPQKVLWPGGGPLVAVGEPTLTADGQWLYFVAVFMDGAGRFNADVGRMRWIGP